MPCRSSARSPRSREHNQKMHSVSSQKLLLLGIPGTSAPMTSRSGLCRSCGRPGRRGAWSPRPMADRRAPLTDSSATKSGGRGRNMSSATGNRYLVGRMGGVRVLGAGEQPPRRPLVASSLCWSSYLADAKSGTRTDSRCRTRTTKTPPSPPHRARAGACNGVAHASMPD